MKRHIAFALMFAPLALAARGQSNAELEEQVRQAETGFAKTMADRDHSAFVSFLADEAIFMGRTQQRGKAQVAFAWKKFYEGKQAPFSWAPETVAVLDSGTLALSSGPVFDPTGKRTGTFNSIWRREKDGSWKIVFDNGCPPCNCTAPSPSPKPGP
jgi:ketosteroid isomerase-like protein